MANELIHQTAIIDPKVNIGNNVKVGPYAIIEAGVTLHDNVQVESHATIRGNTTIGEGTHIFQSAVVGGDPQDKKFTPGEEVFLEIGTNNIIREFSAINAGTIQGGGKTVIGNNNLLMAFSHVAHDCIVGNECIFANAGTIGGHVIVEDKAIIGGLAAAHQFVRIGKYAMLGGCSKATQDVPPFGMTDGVPARLFGINLVGLRRGGFSNDTIKAIKKAYKILFQSKLGKSSAIEQLESEGNLVDEVKDILNFVKASERGVCGVST